MSLSSSVPGTTPVIEAPAVRRLIRGLPLVFVAALALALAACGGGGGEPEAPSTWLELLQRIPDTPETRSWLQMNDYEELRELHGVTTISQDASTEELEAYIVQLLTGVIVPVPPYAFARISPAWITGFYRLEEWRAWDSELGFNFTNVDQDATAGELPHQYQILKGRFDFARIDRTLREDPSYYGTILETVEYGGATLYIWGEDSAQNLRQRTIVRQIGVGGRLAVAGDFVFWTHWTAGAKEMIDAGNDELASLADVAEFRLMANTLTRLNAYSVEVCGSCTLSLSRDRDLIEAINPPSQREETLAALDAETLLLPFQVVATASTVADDRWLRYDTILLVHDDDGAAKENADRLRLRIKEGTSVDGGRAAPEALAAGIEITLAGPVLVARLPPDVGVDLWDLLLTE